MTLDFFRTVIFWVPLMLGRGIRNGIDINMFSLKNLDEENKILMKKNLELNVKNLENRR